MRIQMLTTSASPSGVRQEGQVYTVEKKEGEALIRGGFACKPGEQSSRTVPTAPAKKRSRSDKTEPQPAEPEADAARAADDQQPADAQPDAAAEMVTGPPV